MKLILRAAFVICTSSLAAQTNAAIERIVLPKNVTPLNYKIVLSPDSANLKFKGQVQIELQVNTATSTIKLNSADLDFISAKIANVQDPKISFDKKQETATLQFKKTLKRGKYTLEIAYSGVIKKSAAGLFALDYGTEKDPKRALYTQLENSDARRVFPCWDEPGIKTTFEFSVTLPEDQMAISNTPVSLEKEDKPGFKTVQFRPTPKMSTYLLFFAAGDFERIIRKVSGVEIGVVVKRGDTAKAKYALDTASQILPFFEEYFGVKYPLEKMDMIAAPGSSQFFGAMENWGAILYFDRLLLVDPAITTEATKRDVFLVIAHEMAHQWFGNLVTMDWWDGLWLNEGFATWAEAMATDHFHPEWKIWLDVQNQSSAAMQLDSKSGTHPVIQPIADVLQASQAFDDITYLKGNAVIRMLESYVGADNFKQGVRSYMKKYAYANTVTDQLWHEIDSASPKKISQIAHDFTLQAGVPLIDVKRLGKSWNLTQSRYAVDNSTPQNRKWQVPVDARILTEEKIWQGSVSRSAPAKVIDESNLGILVNAQQSGYYRTRYDQDAFDLLAKNFSTLSPGAQLSLIDDTFSLGASAYVPMSQLLSLLKNMSPGLDAKVLGKFIGVLSYIDYFYTDLPAQATFRAFGLKLLRPILTQIGWLPKPTDNANSAQLRSAVLRTMGRFADKAVVEQAKLYFAEFLKDPKALAAELRSAVLRIVAMQADEKIWEQILQLSLTPSSVVEQQEYYGLLTANNDAKLAKRTLNLALDKKTPATIAPDLIEGTAGRFPKMAYDFSLANHKWLMDSLETQSKNQFIPRMLGESYDRSMVKNLSAYAKKYIPATAKQSVQKAEASIKFNADFREKRIPEIDAWLKSQL